MKRLIRNSVTASTSTRTNDLTFTLRDIVCFLKMIDQLNGCNISLTQNDAGHSQIIIDDKIYDFSEPEYNA